VPICRSHDGEAGYSRRASILGCRYRRCATADDAYVAYVWHESFSTRSLLRTALRGCMDNPIPTPGCGRSYQRCATAHAVRGRATYNHPRMRGGGYASARRVCTRTWHASLWLTSRTAKKEGRPALRSSARSRINPLACHCDVCHPTAAYLIAQMLSKLCIRYVVFEQQID